MFVKLKSFLSFLLFCGLIFSVQFADAAKGKKKTSAREQKKVAKTFEVVNIFGYPETPVNESLVDLLKKYYDALLEKREFLVANKGQDEILENARQEFDKKLFEIESKIEAKYHLVRETFGFTMIDYSVMAENQKMDQLENRLSTVFGAIFGVLIDTNKNKNEAEGEIKHLLSFNQKYFEEWSVEIATIYNGAYRATYREAPGFTEAEKLILETELNDLKRKYDKQAQKIRSQKISEQTKKQQLRKIGQNFDSEVEKWKKKATQLGQENTLKYRLRQSQLQYDRESHEKFFGAPTEQAQSKTSAQDHQQIENEFFKEPTNFYEFMYFQIAAHYRWQQINESKTSLYKVDQARKTNLEEMVHWSRKEMATRYHFSWEEGAGFCFPDLTEMEKNPELMSLYIKITEFLKTGQGIQDFKILTTEQRLAKLNQVISQYKVYFDQWEIKVAEIYKNRPDVKVEYGMAILTEAQKKAIKKGYAIFAKQFEERKKQISESQLSEEQRNQALEQYAAEYDKSYKEWEAKGVALLEKQSKEYVARLWQMVDQHKAAYGITDTLDKPYVHEFYNTNKPVNGVDLKNAVSGLPMQWVDPDQVSDQVLKAILQRDLELKIFARSIREELRLTLEEKEEKEAEIQAERDNLAQAWSQRQAELLKYNNRKEVKLTNVNLSSKPGAKIEMTPDQKRLFIAEIDAQKAKKDQREKALAEAKANGDNTFMITGMLEASEAEIAEALQVIRRQNPDKVADIVFKAIIDIFGELNLWEKAVNMDKNLTNQQKAEKIAEIREERNFLARAWLQRKTELADHDIYVLVSDNIEDEKKRLVSAFEAEKKRKTDNQSTFTQADKAQPEIGQSDNSQPAVSQQNNTTQKITTLPQIPIPAISTKVPFKAGSSQYGADTSPVFFDPTKFALDVSTYEPLYNYTRNAYNRNNEEPNIAKGVYKVKVKDPKSGEEKDYDLPIVVEKTNKDEAQKLSPKELDKLWNDMEYNHQIKRMPGPGGVLKSSVIRYVPSSAAFFAGVGLVMFKDLLIKYENNPVALYQHIENEKDPVARISFFMFITASGLSRKPLMMMLKLPATAARIKFLGMGIGAMVSRLSSSVLNTFRECGNELLHGKEGASKTYEICQKNYNDLVLTDVIIDMAPSIVSMFVASEAAGLVQKILFAPFKTKAGTKATQWAMRWTGVKLLLSVTPQGAQLFGKEMLMEVVQAALFVGIQEYLDPWFISPYQNVLKGVGLDMISSDITEQLIVSKNMKWASFDPKIRMHPEKISPMSEQDCYYHDFVTNPYNLSGEPQEVCDKSLLGNLKDFQKKMSAWRQFNLTGSLTAYQAWNQKIGKISGMAESAKNFYSFILDEIMAVINVDMHRIPRLFRTAPYNGVIPAIPPGYDSVNMSGALSSPENFENDQRIKIKHTLELIETELGPGGMYDESQFPWLESRELKKERKKIVELRDELQLINKGYLYSEDTAKLVKTLQKIHDMGARKFLPDPNTLGRMNEFMEKLINFMGLPNPDMIPGRPYVHAFKHHPLFATFFEETDYPRTPGQLIYDEESHQSRMTDGRYIMNEFADYLVYQMVCGPEVERHVTNMPDLRNCNLVKNTNVSTGSLNCPKYADREAQDIILENKGWQDDLVPPNIRNPEDKIYNYCEENPNASASLRMYDDVLWVDTKDEGRQKYNGPIEYLTKRSRRSVLYKHFLSWWEKNVQSQINEALKTYDVHYDIIVKQFIREAQSNKFTIKDKSLKQIAKDMWELAKDKRFDFFNPGPVPNGAIYSMKQESRLYLLILDELLKDTWIPKMSDEEKKTLISTKTQSVVLNEHLSQYNSEDLPLLTYLLHNEPFDLGSIVKSAKNYKGVYTGTAPQTMILPIETVSERYSEYFTAFINLDGNKSLVDQKEKVKSVKQAVRKMEEELSNLKANIDEPIKNILNPAQLKLAEFCIEGLETLQKEADQYAMMLVFLNSVSEPEDVARDLKENNARIKELIQKLRK